MPSESAVRQARSTVSHALGLQSEQGEAHHVSSPLRWSLIETVNSLSGDSDTPLSEWVRVSAPMGITKTIQAGGHFPLAPVSATVNLVEFFSTYTPLENHPSFEAFAVAIFVRVF